MYTVYMHTSPSGKTYIGITGRDVKLRWGNGGGYAQSPIFNRAIKKYGWKNITHEIIIEGLSKEEAEEKEIELIAKYKSNDRTHGYNVSNGGNCSKTYTDEMRRKVSEASRGRKQSPETIAKRIMRGERHYLYGKHLSDEAKEKMSAAKTGKPMSEETKQKISKTMIGSKQTEEHKRNAANANKIPIKQYNLDGLLISLWKSAADASKYLGRNHAHIVQCCRGQRRTAYGYRWEYDKDRGLMQIINTPV